MKRKVGLLLCMVLCLGLISCGGNKNTAVTESPVSEIVETVESKDTDETKEIVSEEPAKEEISEETSEEASKEETSEEETSDDAKQVTGIQLEPADQSPYDFIVSWYDNECVLRVKQSYLSTEMGDVLAIDYHDFIPENDTPVTVAFYWQDTFWYSGIFHNKYIEDMGVMHGTEAESGEYDWIIKNGWLVTKVNTDEFFDMPDFIYDTSPVDTIEAETQDGMPLVGRQEKLADRSLIEEIEALDPNNKPIYNEIPFISEEEFQSIPNKRAWKIAAKYKIPNVYVYEFGEWNLSENESFLVTGYHKTTAEIIQVIDEEGYFWSKAIFENDTDMLNLDPYLCGYTAKKADNHVSGWDEFNSYDYKLKWFLDHNSREDLDAVIDGNTLTYRTCGETLFELINIQNITHTDGSNFFTTLFGLEPGTYSFDVECTTMYEDFKFLDEEKLKYSREKTLDTQVSEVEVIVR